MIVGLSHGGANGQVNLRRAGDCYRLAESRGHVNYVVQFVGVVLCRGRGGGDRDTRYRRRGECGPAAWIGPCALPFVILRSYLYLVGATRAQAGDRAAPGRTRVWPIGECAADAVLHIVFRDVGTGIGRLIPGHGQAILRLVAHRGLIGLAWRFVVVFYSDGYLLRYCALSGACAASRCDLHDVFVVAPRVRGILEVGIVFEVQLIRVGDLKLILVSSASDVVAGDAVVLVDILGDHPADRLVIFCDHEGIVAGEMWQFVLVGDGDGDRLLGGQGTASRAAGCRDLHDVGIVVVDVRGILEVGRILEGQHPCAVDLELARVPSGPASDGVASDTIGTIDIFGIYPAGERVIFRGFKGRVTGKCGGFVHIGQVDEHGDGALTAMLVGCFHIDRIARLCLVVVGLPRFGAKLPAI